MHQSQGSVLHAGQWCLLLLIGTPIACAIPSSQRYESSPVSPAAAPADSLIGLYYDAVGGLDAIRAIGSRRMRGTYVEGQLHATTDIAWRRPKLRRVNVHAPGFEYSEGYDGVTWEYNFQLKRAVLDTGIAAETGVRGAEFDEPFVEYRAKGHRVELLGLTSLAGHDAIHLRVALADGWQKEYYFDPVTHLIVAMRKAMPIHAIGSAVQTLTRYDDWRLEAGVLQPHRFVERIVSTGEALNTLQWDRIESNVALASAELCPPTTDDRISVGVCARP